MEEMRTIELAGGRGSVLVDAGDFDVLSRHHWQLNRRGYAQGRVGGRIMQMHRFIMNVEPGKFVDHINRNKLDNRRCNLRPCTFDQNRANTGSRSHNTTGYKGVHLYKRTGKWSAYIGGLKTRVHLGYFGSPVEAANAYDNAAKERYGEFAFLNFP